MGKGIALQFKKAFPANFKAYEQAWRRKEVVLGKMFVFDNGQLTKPCWIVNFPTNLVVEPHGRARHVDACCEPDGGLFDSDESLLLNRSSVVQGEF